MIVKNIAIHRDRDPELLEKINILAKHEHIPPTILAKQLLHRELDRLFKELNLDSQQPANLNVG